MSLVQAREFLEAAAKDGVTVRLDDGQIKVTGPEAVKARWLPELAQSRGWISALVRPDDNNPTHRCMVCGGDARFGFGVNSSRGEEGRWACRDHCGYVRRRHSDAANATIRRARP